MKRAARSKVPWKERGDLLTLIRERQGRGRNDAALVTYLNPYSYRIARHNLPLFRQFDEIRIDGIALVLFLKLSGVVSVSRHSFDMSSDAPEVFEQAVRRKQRIFFIGSKAEEVAAAVAKIKGIYPDLQVVGNRHGYFEDGGQRNAVLREVSALKPDIVICGMGTPAQESFLLDLRRSGWDGAGFTCGGFLHQSAERLQYYPAWIDRLHLRWLYRIYREPPLLIRYGWEYPKFVVRFLEDYWHWRFRKGKGEAS